MELAGGGRCGGQVQGVVARRRDDAARGGRAVVLEGPHAGAVPLRLLRRLSVRHLPGREMQTLAKGFRV